MPESFSASESASADDPVPSAGATDSAKSVTEREIQFGCDVPDHPNNYAHACDEWTVGCSCCGCWIDAPGLCAACWTHDRDGLPCDQAKNEQEGGPLSPPVRAGDTLSAGCESPAARPPLGPDRNTGPGSCVCVVCGVQLVHDGVSLIHDGDRATVHGHVADPGEEYRAERRDAFQRALEGDRS